MTQYSPYGRLSRREWLRLSTAGFVGFSLSGWLETLAQDAATHPHPGDSHRPDPAGGQLRRRACLAQPRLRARAHHAGTPPLGR